MRPLSAPIARVWRWLAPDALSAGLTKTMLEAALEGRCFERLFYNRRDGLSWDKGNLMRGLGRGTPPFGRESRLGLGRTGR